MNMLVTLLAAFFVALSFMSAPSAASHQLNNNLQNSLQKVEGDRHDKFTSLPSLPRKLQLNEEVKRSAEKNTFVMPQKEFLESSSGTKQHENDQETMMHKTNRKEGFEEGPNKSEYFNMDYTWVRKKRPIHN